MNAVSKNSRNLKSAIQNRKWAGIAALAIAFAMCGAVAHAQQPRKIYRIGYLDPAASNNTVLLAAFQQELSKLGWIEGKNFTIEQLYKGPDRVPELAADLARLKIDLIFVSGAQPASAAKSATT